MTSNLVTVQWLNEHLNDENIIILDATMKKKPNGDLIAVPTEKIPHAQIFNFDTEICDQNTHLPHMLCTAHEFEVAVRKLGINIDTKIIIYDAMGVFSSPRAWWMFKVMGHKNVVVLNGGLPAWKDKHFDIVEYYSTKTVTGNFSTGFDHKQVVSSTQILNIIKGGEELEDYKVTKGFKNTQKQILDARSIARFKGKEAEPRQGLKRGHIPHSTCLPFTEVLSDGLLKDKDELHTIFNSIINIEDGFESSQPLIFSCGSGVTACILALAAAECGFTNTAVYDGSWSEWGASKHLPTSLS